MTSRSYTHLWFFRAKLNSSSGDSPWPTALRYARVQREPPDPDTAANLVAEIDAVIDATTTVREQVITARGKATFLQSRLAGLELKHSTESSA
jgi:hypothetical protein